MYDISEEENIVEKKTTNTKKKFLVIFVSAFIVFFVIVIQFASWLTPSVDVEIGTEPESESEQSDNTKKMIDERLKLIQFEDNTIVSDKEQSNSIQVDLDESENGQYNQEKNNDIKTQKTDVLEQQNNFQFDENITNLDSVKTKMNKVYIGDYSTVEEALDIQSKLMDINLGVTPYINGKDGKFFIQAGAFTNIELAKGVVQHLKQYGFNAKIIQE